MRKMIRRAAEERRGLLAGIIGLLVVSGTLAMSPAAKSWQISDFWLRGFFKPADDFLSKESELKFRDCELKKSAELIDKTLGIYREVMVFKYKGKDIRRVQLEMSETGLKNSWHRFGFHPLLGNEQEKQIVLMEYSGGAHCCWSYWIYMASPLPAEIYSTEKWGLGSELRYADADRTGASEISQSVTAFDYFDRCSHASSPMPRIIFKYNEPSGEYLPANNLFADELLQDTDKKITNLNRFSMEKDDAGGIFLGAVLNIVLPHVYAGREKEGWEIFDRVYNLRDKEEMKSKIKAKLKEEKVYQYLYGSDGRRTGFHAPPEKGGSEPDDESGDRWKGDHIPLQIDSPASLPSHFGRRGSVAVQSEHGDWCPGARRECRGRRIDRGSAEFLKGV